MPARDLETIVLKCLHKEPHRRYASALALAEDVERFLKEQPILARPTPTWERTIKWARRQPAVAGLLAVSTMALVVFLGLWARFTAELQTQRDLARALAEASGTSRQEDTLLLASLRLVGGGGDADLLLAGAREARRRRVARTA